MTFDPGTADQLRSALASVAAIPVTPFGPDGQVDWDAHGLVIRRMVDAGVRLVTPNGNTGEFYALTAAEARAGVTEVGVSSRPRQATAPGRPPMCWPGWGMTCPARSRPGGMPATMGCA